MSDASPPVTAPARIGLRMALGLAATRDDAIVMSKLTIDDRTVASWIWLNP